MVLLYYVVSVICAVQQIVQTKQQNHALHILVRGGSKGKDGRQGRREERRKRILESSIKRTENTFTYTFLPSFCLKVEIKQKISYCQCSTRGIVFLVVYNEHYINLSRI